VLFAVKKLTAKKEYNVFTINGFINTKLNPVNVVNGVCLRQFRWYVATGEKETQ